MREREMDSDALFEFARRVVSAARPHGARVLVNGDVDLARGANADGVHLQAGQLLQLSEPPPVEFWAASCHNAAELARAAQLNAGFVVLSPVLATPTHPEAAGMGWAQFAQRTRDYPLPVYALGGMKPELLDTAMQHGAHGIALLSGIW